MKALNYLKISLLSLILFAAQITMADRTDKVNSLQITNLTSYNGQFVSVFYVIGTQPFIVTSSSQIQVQQIQAVALSQQITNGMVTVPAVELVKEGLRPSYNFIVIVIHPQSDFKWTNADGSVPPGPQIGTNTSFTRIISLTKGEYERTLLQQGNPPLVTISR